MSGLVAVPRRMAALDLMSARLACERLEAGLLEVLQQGKGVCRVLVCVCDCLLDDGAHAS